MVDRLQGNYLTTELDVDLLATPYEFQTNWHVIMGGPSCGKTTLVNLLADRGFPTVAEGARLYMERQVANGRTIEDLRANMVALQCGIKDMQLEIERGLHTDEFAFLDRGLPDCLAWHRAFGLDPNQFLKECFRHRYASVFMLDQLPLQLDGFRFEENTLTSFLNEWHMRDYHALGYTVVKVPVQPPEERLAFVLEKLTEQGFL